MPYIWWGLSYQWMQSVSKLFIIFTKSRWLHKLLRSVISPDTDMGIRDSGFSRRIILIYLYPIEMKVIIYNTKHHWTSFLNHYKAFNINELQIKKSIPLSYFSFRKHGLQKLICFVQKHSAPRFVSAVQHPNIPAITLSLFLKKFLFKTKHTNKITPPPWHCAQRGGWSRSYPLCEPRFV